MHASSFPASNAATLISYIYYLHPPRPFSRIILFGSYAYGTADEESDLDILVVEEKVTSRMEEMRKVRKALVDIPLSKDIIVCDEEYFNSHSTPEWVNTALYDASKKGVVPPCVRIDVASEAPIMSYELEIFAHKHRARY